MTEDLWALGDYAVVARRLRPAAERLVALAGIGPGDRVVDLAAGTGNVAVAAARRGAQVLAIDASPALVGRGRAATAGLPVEWAVGDFDAIDAPDGSFDAALSAFGLIYAADARAAVAEAFRVVRSDGVVGVAAWPDGSFQHAASRATAPDAPPSPWGTESGIASLLASHASTLVVDEVRFGWCFESVADWIDEAERVAPPMIALRDAFDEGAYAAVRVALSDAAARFATPVDGGVVIEQRALIAVARHRKRPSTSET